MSEFFFESPEHSLHGNIGVSVIADEGVNVDMFFAFAKTILEEEEGKDTFKYSLKRSGNVKMLSTKTFLQFSVKDDAKITLRYCFKS